MSEHKSARIAALNDAFRTSFNGGRVVMTASVNAFDPDLVNRIIEKVKSFDGFNRDNDPYGEHDFGAFEIDGKKIFWKVDTYADDTFTYGAEDPTDPDCVRVLTIMLAEDY